MDWSDNIPASKDRPAKRSGGLPSFTSMLGWAGIAFIVWFLWALFSPPLMQKMFGPLLLIAIVGFVAFMVAGLILRGLWAIIRWTFRGGR